MIGANEPEFLNYELPKSAECPMLIQGGNVRRVKIATFAFGMNHHEQIS
jgi:hypothetical protein